MGGSLGCRVNMFLVSRVYHQLQCTVHVVGLKDDRWVITEV